MYRYLFQPLVFLIAPERAHALTVFLLKLALAVPGLGAWLRRNWQAPPGPALTRKLFGLTFPNPVGLAAGFDKDGKALAAMSALGFGFLELGTVTPRPQAGNARPRLFRLKKDRALINRMGFNNEGVDALANRLKKGRPPGVIVGGNIGKNKTTPNEEAVQDYLYCFERLFPYVDYFVVNVSSPNTPNLRELQEKAPLTRLLGRLQERNRHMPAPKPLLLKIAPDLNEAQLDDIIAIARETELSGIIATNTTISRPELTAARDRLEKIGPGGLSGQPLRKRSTSVIRYIYRKTNGTLPIIGVGGIASPDDALEKLNAGASLVQIYTGLVYEGPILVRQINEAVQAAEKRKPIAPTA